jgi:DNA replication and repair protein RecF
MIVTHTDKQANAAQCSTGEQKALLTAIILAHAHLVTKRFGTPPLLLFDEVCAHFDAKKQSALFEILSNLGGQIWLSGQNTIPFQEIKNKNLLTISDNKILT